MQKTALIVGAGGQDGRCLESHLRTSGYRLICLERTALRLDDGVIDPAVDISSPDQVSGLLGRLQPAEVYHLAAFHHSSQDPLSQDLQFYRRSYEVNFFSLLNFLEGIRLRSPKTRLFYAGSSHVFGPPEDGSELQSEETPFRAQSVYAMTKVDGILACRHYRERHDVFASAGILFNHESTFRKDTFLSKKVVRAAVATERGYTDKLVIGDLKAEVDWGYAPDFVEAMRAILLLEAPDDFVVATGIKHRVDEFVEAAFREVGLDWTNHVVENPQTIKSRRRASVGDATKLTRATNWRPKTSFLEMIRLLVRDEKRRS